MTTSTLLQARGWMIAVGLMLICLSLVRNTSVSMEIEDENTVMKETIVFGTNEELLEKATGDNTLEQIITKEEPSLPVTKVEQEIRSLPATDADEEKFVRVSEESQSVAKVEQKSANKNSVSSSSPYENCKGTAAERRALAGLGDDATKDDWRNMAKCIRKRESRLKGHYVQHVSKSAGEESVFVCVCIISVLS